MSAAKYSLRRDVVAVTAARILSPLSSSLLIIALARLTGPAGLGQYTLLVTLFQLFEYVKSFGLPALLVRECSGKDAAVGLAWRRELIRFGATGALGLCILLPLAVSLQPAAEIIPAAVMAVGLFPSAVSMANDAFLLASGRSPLTAWLALGEGLLRMALSLAAVAADLGLAGLAGVYVFGRAAHAAAGWLMIRGIRGGEDAGRRPVAAAALRAEALSFAMIFVLPLALFRLDVIVLGWLAPAATLGIYGAALRIFSVGLVLPDGVLSAVFATFARLHGEGRAGELRHVLRKTALRLGAVLVGAATIGSLLAPWVMRTLFGEEFAGSAGVLAILLWALPVFAWNRTLGDALVATGGQRIVGRIVIGSLLFGIAVYPPLIVGYGAVGAAWALLIVSGAIGAASAWFAVARGLIRTPELAPFVLPVICGLTAAALPAGGARVAAMVSAMALTFWWLRPERSTASGSLPS